MTGLRRYGGWGVRRGQGARAGGDGGGGCNTPYTVMTTHSIDVGGESYEAGVITPADVVVTHPADTIRVIERC